MVPVTVSLIPTPMNTDLYERNVQYLVVDQHGLYHIAEWDGEDLFIPDLKELEEEAEPEVDPTAVNTDPVPMAGDEPQPEEEVEEEPEEDPETVYVEFIARLPAFVAPHYL